ERNAAARVNHQQAILHRAKNCLGAGFAPGHLTIEFLLARKNTLQRQANPLRVCSAIDQESARPLAAPDLRHELFNLSPRRSPFSPEHQYCHYKYATDYGQD